MVRLERAILPLLTEAEFGLASATAVLSFVATFGLVKALTNLAAGKLADRWGRRRVLIAGWLFGLPVPLLLIAAPSWSWVVLANVFLGLNQGLAWSTTVIMKIDLVGPTRRGLAMGLNEFAGYLALALTALATGYLAAAHGLRPVPFLLGIAFAVLGLGITVLFVRETSPFVALESRAAERAASEPAHVPTTRQVLASSLWRSPALSSASHAGMVNNLNDGLAWGLLPLLFAAGWLSVSRIGLIAFLYPAVWGIAQLWTGAVSDRVGRKPLIVWGMVLQGAALLMVAVGRDFGAWAAAAVLLGLGIAMVYPTLLAAVADTAHPLWRGSAVGICRFWRDGGYVVGALGAGLLADVIGMRGAIGAVAVLTDLSGTWVALRMPETLYARSV